jgi:predicted nucleic acid-binding protein
LARAAVVDASPLIYLTEVAQLELLRLAGDQVFLPRAVADEVRRWGQDDPAVRALDATPWLKTIETPTVPASVEAWNLGAGEAAVLSYALAHPGVDAIMDDLAGRRCAIVHHVNVRACLGLVLVAKQRRVIPLARPLVEALREAGLYLSDGAIRRALALWANERRSQAREIPGQ